MLADANGHTTTPAFWIWIIVAAVVLICVGGIGAAVFLCQRKSNGDNEVVFDEQFDPAPAPIKRGSEYASVAEMTGTQTQDHIYAGAPTMSSRMEVVYEQFDDAGNS